MARLSLLCHFVGVSKNSTRQALSNLEPLYKCIKLTGKKKIWNNLSVKSNKQQTNQPSQSKKFWHFIYKIIVDDFQTSFFSIKSR